MANNPYSPPTADVTEPAPARDPASPRPRIVFVGIGILAVLAAYMAVSFAFMPNLETVRRQGTTSLVVVFLLPLALLLVQVTVIVFAFLRRNWARVVLLALLAWSILGTVISLYTFSRIAPAGSFGRVATSFFISWGLLVLRGVAVGLLFTPSANAWFKPRAAR